MQRVCRATERYRTATNIPRRGLLSDWAVRVQGNAAFKIEVNTPGGHSSMPPLDGAHTARVMADIIREIDTVPPPLHMQAPMTDCLQAVAPFVGPLLRSVLARADQWCAPAPLS